MASIGTYPRLPAPVAVLPDAGRKSRSSMTGGASRKGLDRSLAACFRGMSSTAPAFAVSAPGEHRWEARDGFYAWKGRCPTSRAAHQKRSSMVAGRNQQLGKAGGRGQRIREPPLASLWVPVTVQVLEVLQAPRLERPFALKHPAVGRCESLASPWRVCVCQSGSVSALWLCTVRGPRVSFRAAVGHGSVGAVDATRAVEAHTPGDYHWPTGRLGTRLIKPPLASQKRAEWSLRSWSMNTRVPNLLRANGPTRNIPSGRPTGSKVTRREGEWLLAR